MGEKHLKLTLALSEYAEHMIDAIAFNIDLEQWPNTQAKKIKSVFQLAVNEFRGTESVQCIIRHIEAI